MKIFKIPALFLVLAVLVALLSPAALAIDAPETFSNAKLLMETDSRNIIYAENENARVYPASTTKIMTVLLAIEAVEDGRVSMNDMVTAAESMNYDMIPDGSSAGIQVGETMSLQDLLYCAMLASGNDACNVIAEYIGGSIEKFIDMMNSRAAELGCVGTHFANTHGLPSENHYTTVWDFAQISLEAISHSEFMAICDSPSYEVKATNLSMARKLTNTNGLINNDSEMYPGYQYEYAHGVKTGHTNDAGYCLVSTATKDGVQLLCVIMGGAVIDENGAVKYSNFTDSRTLYDWGFENFSFKDILKSNEAVATAKVVMGSDADKVSLKPQNNLRAFLPNDVKQEDFEFDIKAVGDEVGGAFAAPIAAGDVLGEVTVTLNGVNYGTVKLVAASGIDLSKMSYIKNELKSVFSHTWVNLTLIILLLFAVVYIILVILYRRRRRRYIKSLRAKQNAERKRRAQEAARKAAAQAERETVSAAPVSAPEPSNRDYFDEYFKK